MWSVLLNASSLQTNYTVLASYEMPSVLLHLLCIGSHILVLSLLSVRRWQLSHDPAGGREKTIPPSVIKLLGGIVALATLALPHNGPGDAFQQCGVRVACFFYAFKLLDLAWTKADDPPKLLSASGSNKLRLGEQAEYVWLLLTEMRYSAFNTKAVQKARPAEDGKGTLVHRLLPPLTTISLAYAFPVAETKCLLLLCVIQNALEALHTLLHPWCPSSLFYRPFVAATLGDFWTMHWHASAVFLQSLAYKPGRRLVGRWFGVLAAFALSGAWHGWASMPLVDNEHAMMLGLKVWTFFVMLGVGTLVERIIWQDRQGRIVQRMMVWAWSAGWAGWCLRTLECHSRIAFLRDARCGS